MKTNRILLLLLSVIVFSCGDHYSMEDFSSVEKTDAHFHVYTAESSAMEQAEKDNFKLLVLNTNTSSCEHVVETQQWMQKLDERYTNKIAYSTTFCVDGWDEPAWTQNTINWLDQCFADGANSVKVWKNIGMKLHNKDGKLVMIDDPQFDAVFAHLAAKQIPVVAHMGEPKNCWLPLNEMTTKNDSSYYARQAQYHMFKHPEMPSYNEQMSARDHMLDKNPTLVFIGCHLASLEWSVDTLAEWLDKYPKAAVDLSGRMGQLFYQTCENREKVRTFFINYQDRILYGTDIIDGGGAKEKLFEQMHKTWLRDWEYFCTKNEMTSDLIVGEFSGLQLPKEVVDKVFYQNAFKWYGSF